LLKSGELKPARVLRGTRSGRPSFEVDHCNTVSFKRLESCYQRGFGNSVAACKGVARTNRAPASWTAAVLCRFSTATLTTQSGRGLPQSKTSRNFPAGFQQPGYSFSKTAQAVLSVKEHGPWSSIGPFVPKN
jgi:hypothetical protein